MGSDRTDVSMGSMLGVQEMAEVRAGGGGEPLPMVWQTGVSMGRGLIPLSWLTLIFS